MTVCQFQMIVGLGNPGPRFEKNRHNIGFRIVDLLAHEVGTTVWKAKDEALITAISIHTCSILLVKPQTFMNDSGRAVATLMKHKGIALESVLVVHDELELPFGSIKIKKGGSHHGHNGLRSIMALCGADFTRIRFGIGRPADKNSVPDYVLSNFTSKEEEQLPDLARQAVGLILQIVSS